MFALAESFAKGRNASVNEVANGDKPIKPRVK